MGAPTSFSTEKLPNHHMFFFQPFYFFVTDLRHGIARRIKLSVFFFREEAIFLRYIEYTSSGEERSLTKLQVHP